MASYFYRCGYFCEIERMSTKKPFVNKRFVFLCIFLASGWALAGVALFLVPGAALHTILTRKSGGGFRDVSRVEFLRVCTVVE